jgi:DNA end-binding protein Ku
VHYQKVVPGIGPITPDEIVRGYEIGDDEYVLLETDELEAIKLETKKTIELVQFVDGAEIDPRWFERPFYVEPDGDISIEAYTVVREALTRSKKLGLGQMAVRGRENLVALQPCGRGLLLENLRYADEIRDAGRFFDLFAGADADKAMVALAAELIAKRSGPFEAEAFTDNYADALRELVEKKRKGRAIVARPEEEPAEEAPRRGAEIVDLMKALKRSVAGDRKPAATQSRGHRRRTG